jgi:ribulose 1,5-bisphosphate carboxylase large subunit-like protein
MRIIVDHKDLNKYFWATYYVKSVTTLEQAAREICIGQTIGNPNARSNHETDWMIEHYCGKILFDENLSHSEGTVQIGYPYALMDWHGDGISQLLCILMGGQMDIDNILKCHLLKVEISPQVENKYFLGPKYGINGIRDFVGSHNQPLFGGIVKPKNGITPLQLLDMTKQMVEGGVHFIKEDEILSNPQICPLEERVPLISKYLEHKNVVYCFCINGDHGHVLERAKFVAENGGKGVHINVWSGLGVHRSVRNLDLPLFVHYQKSGDRTFTNPAHDYHISWDVLCYLASLSGVDFIHAGMWGGYLNMGEQELHHTLNLLRSHQVMPALSCGMRAELVQPIVERFGVDWMANVGGAIHSDPQGTREGCKKMRAAVDGAQV